MWWLLGIFHVSKSAFIEYDESIWYLNSENIEEAIKEQDGILIEFFSLSCHHCAELAPEYVKAGKVLKENGLYLGMVNGEENPSLLEKYDITGFPTLLYFTNGMRIRYKGKRTGEAISKWVLERRITPYVMVLETADQDYLKSAKMAAVYIGDIEDPLRAVFDQAYSSIPEIIFAIRNSTFELVELNSTSPVVIFYRDMLSFQYTLTESYDELFQFFELHKPPKVYLWNDETHKLIMEYKTTAFILFVDNDKEADYTQILEKLSDKYHTHLIFTSVDLADDTTGITKIVGFQRDSQPIALILDSSQKLSKYKTEKTTAEELDLFIEKWVQGSLPPYYRSEPIPQIQFEKRVRTLVGSNFAEHAYDENKHIIVLFYVEGQEESEELISIFNRVAFELKNSKDLELAKIEVQLNEVEGITLEGIPGLIIYPKKYKKGYYFQNYGSKYNFIEFIKAYL